MVLKLLKTRNPKKWLEDLMWKWPTKIQKLNGLRNQGVEVQATPTAASGASNNKCIQVIIEVTTQQLRTTTANSNNNNSKGNNEEQEIGITIW